MTQGETAQHLGISRRTLIRWMKRAGYPAGGSVAAVRAWAQSVGLLPAPPPPGCSDGSDVTEYATPEEKRYWETEVLKLKHHRERQRIVDEAKAEFEALARRWLDESRRQLAAANICRECGEAFNAAINTAWEKVTAK